MIELTIQESQYRKEFILWLTKMLKKGKIPIDVSHTIKIDNGTYLIKNDKN